MLRMQVYAFPTFGAFREAMTAGGVAALELCSMDMKRMGAWRVDVSLLVEFIVSFEV